MSDAVKSLVQWSALRTPSPAIVSELRAVDPTAELIYWGRGRWLLGSVRWDREVVEKAARKMQRELAVLHKELWTVNRGGEVRLDRSRLERFDLSVLGCQGFRPIGFYSEAEYNSGYLVMDFRRATWLYRTTTDEQLFASIDEQRNAPRRQAREDMRDPERGRAAWKYAFTLSHLVRNNAPATGPASSARSRVHLN